MSDSEGHLVIPDAPEGTRTKSVEERLGGKAPLRGAPQTPERDLPLPGADGKPANGKSDELPPETIAEIDALKARTEAQDRAIADANRRATEAHQREQQARADALRAHEAATGAELEKVTSRMDSLTKRRAAIQEEIKTAGTDLNWDRVAELTNEIGDVAAEIRDLNRSKGEIEAKKAKAPKPEERQPQQQPQKQYATFGEAVVASPEEFIRSRTPRTQEWLRANPSVLKSADKVDELVAAHNMAVAKKLVPDTDAYFNYIEQATDMNEDGAGKPPPKQTQRQERKAPAAPPSRDSAPTINGKPANLRNGDRYVPPAMKEFVERMFPAKTAEEAKANLESYCTEYEKDVRSGASQDRWGYLR